MLNTARKSLPRTGEVVEMPIPAAEKLDAAARIKQLAFWSKLNPSEQDQLLSETDHLLTAQQLYGLTAVEVGQRLLNVRRLLTPYGAWLKFLAAYYRESERTAYRKVNDYEVQLELLGRPVVEAMISNGLSLDEKGNLATRKKPLGKYTKAYNKLLALGNPPPKEASEQEALRWVRQLQIEYERCTISSAQLAEVKSRSETHSNIQPITHSFNDLLKRDFYSIQSSLEKLPGRRADEYIEELVGFLLTRRGVSGKRFVAHAIPDHFKRSAGRPSHNRGAD